MTNRADEKKLDCTIIIVSFNTRDLTDECLKRIKTASEYSHQTLGNTIQTIVVDNASSDQTVEMIRKKHPFVRLMAQKDNLRFGKGNNVAFAKTTTPFILMLNSDTLIEKETLVKILTFMEKNPSCDALCCQLTFPDGRFQRAGGNLPTPLNTVLWSFGIDSIPGLKQILHPIYNYNESFYAKEKQIEWCQGSFMLIKQEVYKKTHGFDEKIYFYMEDIEWCKRIKDAGFKLYFTPDISVVHLAGGSSKKLAQLDRLEKGATGMLYFMKKHYPQSRTLIKHCMEIGMLLRTLFYFLAGDRQMAQTYRQLSTFIRKS